MKSGFAVMIGRSNVGKSTLMNALVGTKVAITTPKPQTTRKPIQGALTTDDGQVVFVDTPGILQKTKDPLTQKLIKYVSESLKEIDIVLYVVDPTRKIGNEEKQTLKLIEKIEQPKILVINKIDDRASLKYIDFYRDLFESQKFDKVVEVSAKTGSNLDILKRLIFENLPEGEPMYDRHEVSNISKEEQLAEIIREKLFLRLREEVPYSVHVVVNEIDKRKNGTLFINATVFTNEERYKSMIIGKGGRGIKEIGQSTRKELEAITNDRVFLELDVQYDPHWLESF